MTDTQVKVTPTIDAIVTFHSEGIVAHRTLLGLNRLRDHAAKAGIRVGIIAVLDSADGDTREIVINSPLLGSGDQIIEVSNGEAGLSRNDGIRASRSDYVGIFDGDDYYSANWLTEALATSCSRSGNVIVHPEYQISFGTIHCIARSIDMDETPDYPLANCLTVNPWGVCSFGRRELYLQCPYHSLEFKEKGFGFEDWHWNLEVLSQGMRHVTALGTCHFYRRKPVSALTSQMAGGAVIKPGAFFLHDQPWWSHIRAPDMQANNREHE